MVEVVERHHAHVVRISATPPAAVMHARYPCKRLRDRFAEAKLIVGLGNAKGDLRQAGERVVCGTAGRVVATLASSQELVRQIMQSPLHRREEHAPRKTAPMVVAETSV